MLSTDRPLPPQPTFRVVNATHIEVKWDKPYANPEVDVQYYTLTIYGIENSTKEVYTYSGDTTYPIRHFQSNGGVIPTMCNYLQFNLTATNAAGTSDAGSVMGGFPIGKRTISYTKLSLCHFL